MKWVAIVLVLSLSAPMQFDERLESLHPRDPRAYFELAEEIVDARHDDAESLATARNLFGLAAMLDADRFGRSACLALAEIETSSARRARLIALADLLGSATDARFGPELGEGFTAPSRGAALAVIDALSLYRLGEGRRAEEMLTAPAAEALFEQVTASLPGGARRIREDFELYKGVRRSSLRPSLSDPVIARMLLIETLLHGDRERSFARDLALTGDRPLLEVDPGRLAETLEVDVSRPLYRNGGWVSELPPRR